MFKINRYDNINHMLSISLPHPVRSSGAAFQSLIGRVARYTPSSDFEMQLLNSTQYDGN